MLACGRWFEISLLSIITAHPTVLVDPFGSHAILCNRGYETLILATTFNAATAASFNQYCLSDPNPFSTASARRN
jgi:CII-binding regulator of phage lambda lysogenization HflD